MQSKQLGARTIGLSSLLAAAVMFSLAPTAQAAGDEPDPVTFRENLMKNGNLRTQGTGEGFAWHAAGSTDTFLEAYLVYQDPRWLEEASKYYDFYIGKLQKDPDESKLPMIEKAYAAESNAAIKQQLGLVRAAALLSSSDGAKRMAAAKLLAPEGRSSLAAALPALEATDWTAPALEEAARAHAEASGLKLGQVAQPLRAALTGKAASPPLFAMLALLGRVESLNRLRAYTSS